MSEPRSVVITGASRGLGLASAVHLHRQGWRVIGAMRSPAAGLDAIRTAAGLTGDDGRLIGIRLDLEDAAAIEAAAEEIGTLVGAPDALVHNAGIASVGCLEEMPSTEFERIFATNVFGPARLTRALLPAMRAAGSGRIVVISSAGGVHGIPGISAYSSSKGALERWAEALSMEVAPFGIGVTVLVAGTFKTDIIDRAHTVQYGDPDGPYRPLHDGQNRLEDRFLRLAAPPERFAAALARSLDGRAPFARHAVGADARALRVGSWLLPSRALHRVVGRVMGIPAHGALRAGTPVRKDDEGLVR